MITGDDPILTIIIFVLTTLEIILARMFVSDSMAKRSKIIRTIFFLLTVYFGLVIIGIMILTIYLTIKARLPWLQ
jgi:hypothetical protein